MKKVTLDEILGLERYEREREGLRRRIIELKKARRVSVGDRVTLVFENHDTMLFQIQEMLRAEHITDIDRVRDEIDVYNALIPAPGELSATLLIEITDSDEIRPQLLRLIGIDEAVHMEIGDSVVRAQFEPGHSREDKISAVQYVRFALDEGQRSAFLDPSCRVRLVIAHPNYRHSAALEGNVRASLCGDLRRA